MEMKKEKKNEQTMMDEYGVYLKMSLVQPWYPTLMRLSAVEDLRHSLLEDIKKILKPLPLMSLKNLSVSLRAGALFFLIHSSKEVTFNFSPLSFHSPYTNKISNEEMIISSCLNQRSDSNGAHCVLLTGPIQQWT